MVNLVLVSHSQKLAEGIRELISQMTVDKVGIAIAAGIDDPEQPIGTNPVAIRDAIQSVNSDDGVLVLVDIGSAVISTETAIELLEPICADKVSLCAAPLVEGAIAAAISAAANMPLHIVIKEAHGALTAKYQVMQQYLPQTLTQEKSPTISDIEPHDKATNDKAAHNKATHNQARQSKTVSGEQPNTTIEHSFSLTVRNPNGLHTRPAATIVAAMRHFQADITLSKNDKKMNAKSLNKIMMLGIRYGDEVIFSAIGNDAEKAIEVLKQLAKIHFGEQKN